MIETTVKFRLALLWTCGKCGLENVERSKAVETEEFDRNNPPACLDDEDVQAIIEYIEEGGGGTWIKPPEQVQCSLCESKFATVPHF